MKAAVWSGVGDPLTVRELDLVPVGPGMVKVQLAASGVCHSDLTIAQGAMVHPAPAVLGHEGAGVVTEVGEGVTRVAPGDHVVLSWVPQCGECYQCRHGHAHVCEAYPRGTFPSPFRAGGETVHQLMNTGTFAEATIVPAAGVVRIDDDIPLQLAALIGCAVLTGTGAALNSADIERGDLVAVFGCGGVGLNTVQGARLAGAARIVAVDTNPAKLELARRFGATEVVDASRDDAVEALRDLSDGRGVDVAFEVIGTVGTVTQALAATRRAGQTVVVGVAPDDAVLPLPLFAFMRSAVRLVGCYYGSSTVLDDVPRLIEHYRAGELLLDELVSDEIELEGVQAALDAIEKGTVTRSVIRY